MEGSRSLIIFILRFTFREKRKMMAVICWLVLRRRGQLEDKVWHLMLEMSLERMTQFQWVRKYQMEVKGRGGGGWL